MKLLFARIGRTYSPISGLEVKKDVVSDVVDHVKKIKIQTKLLLLAPIKTNSKISSKEKIKIFKQQGFARIYYNEKVFGIDDLKKIPEEKFDLVIDRLITRNNNDFYDRLSDAVEIAFYEGKGVCSILQLENKKRKIFSNKFELDGIKFFEPSIHLFSFNNPLGACSKCEGFGDVIGIDPDLVIPDTSKSIYDGVISPWKGSTLSKYQKKLINSAYLFDFPIHKPYYELSEDNKKLIWEGNTHFTGINSFFKKIEKKNYKIQNRVLLSRYRGKTLCDSCQGTRLNESSNFVKINGKSIGDL